MEHIHSYVLGNFVMFTFNIMNYYSLCVVSIEHVL